MKNIFLAICLIITGSIAGFTQDTYLNLEVISGNRSVLKQEGVIENIFNDEWKLKKRELTDRAWEAIRSHMKIRTQQGLRDENMNVGSQRFFSVNMQDTSCYLTIHIPDISVSFYITTRDVLGIGQDRSEDPYISFKFSVTGTVWLSQKGDAKSIGFREPVWTYTIQESKFRKIESLSWSNHIDGDVRSLAYSVKEQFYLLNDFKFKINNFINDKIIEDPKVQKEFSIDENNQLLVVAENTNKLVFKHNYSQTGMVKRTSTTDASTIKENVQTAPQVPTTTSPGSINEKPASTGSQLPPTSTTTSPTGANQGPKSTNTTPTIPKVPSTGKKNQ